MKKSFNRAVPVLLAVSIAVQASASPRLDLPDTAFDAGIASAESLGRGGTHLGLTESLGAAVENAAGLFQPQPNSIYVTTLVGTTSSLSSETIREADPLDGNVLQYIAIGAEKGAIFFQPIARLSDYGQATSTSTETDMTVNAFGFAAANAWKKGSVGLSVAYLWGAVASEPAVGVVPFQPTHDVANGFRVNTGFQLPTGPAMWSLNLRNFPAFLFWKHYRRELLPIGIRVGNRYMVSKSTVLTAEVERRYYNEGSNEETYYYIGAERSLSKTSVLRGGTYSEGDYYGDKVRHWTVGLTLSFSNQVSITFGGESFKIEDESVKRSLVSLQLPFAADEE